MPRTIERVSKTTLNKNPGKAVRMVGRKHAPVAVTNRGILQGAIVPVKAAVALESWAMCHKGYRGAPRAPITDIGIGFIDYGEVKRHSMIRLFYREKYAGAWVSYAFLHYLREAIPEWFARWDWADFYLEEEETA